MNKLKAKDQLLLEHFI